ncbi:protein halfway [Bacillus rossius redtenbacheri]|uniref:protein halfway n=1 Tax=Bacillus rossius redtenbacheri TaxID=93214 RepID=UPI002FDED356
MRKHTKGVCVSEAAAVVVLASLLTTVVAAEGENLTRPCVHYGPEDCLPLPEVGCRTMELPDGDHALLCCNMRSRFILKERVSTILLADKNITALHIRNLSLETLDITFLKNQSLVSLAITDSSGLGRLTGQLGLDSLACLNLSSNALATVEPGMLLGLLSLGFLDLSSNSLSRLPYMPETNGTLGVDMFDNDDVVCHHVKEKMEQSNNLQFQRRGETKCSAERYFNWFNSTDHLSLTTIELIGRLEQTCPRGDSYNCSCKFARLVTMENQMNQLAHLLVEVDCSGRNLTQLPESLPSNTEVINITNNHVTSLAPLVSNPAYKEVRIFIADNNNISSIMDLEGSNFINSFDILGLKRNNLKTLPTYILSNSFDRVNEKKLNLGYNKFHCDCTTAQIVKMWLVANKKYIPDVNDIQCEDGGKVIDLDRSVVCATQRKWTDYIYYIIAAQVVLLVFLIGKFLYDYWVFKSTGYLPWIASKMPKMPCDWVFET